MTSELLDEPVALVVHGQGPDGSDLPGNRRTFETITIVIDSAPSRRERGPAALDIELEALARLANGALSRAVHECGKCRRAYGQLASDSQSGLDHGRRRLSCVV